MMLSAVGCQTRRQRLLERVEVEFIIISNPRHIQYFSGLYIAQTALGGWGPNFLLIDGQSGHSTLLVHNSLRKQAQTAHVDALKVWTWYDGPTHSGKPIFREAVRQLNQLLEGVSTERVGVEAGLLPREVAIGKGVDLTDIVLQLRRRKDSDELELIRAAIQAVEAGHEVARQVIKPGLTELDIYTAMYTAIVETAGRQVLPMGDFVSGNRAGLGGPTSRKLQVGELMILDIFPIVNGYRADFTTTLAIDNRLTEQQARLEAALHAGLAAGEGQLRAGIGGQQVHQAVKAALAEHGFGEGFTHHAGHGLGLGHPELPYFVSESEDVLMAGDVVTLEPGSYGPGFGARIEHDYLILEDGFERLTNHDTRFIS